MKGQVDRIRWNSLYAFLSQVIRLATNFLMFVGIARLYGIDAFGQFTTAHTFSTIFLLFADFGFDSLLPTEIARRREHAAELAQRYFSLKIVFAVGATVAMLLLPLFRPFTSDTRVLIQVFSLYVLFASLNNFCFALFKGFEEFQHETKISFSTNLVMLVLLLGLGAIHAPLWFIASAFVGSRVIGLVVGFRIASRLLKGPVMRFQFHGWRDIWKPTMVFGLHFIFGNLFFQIDTILLAFWRGDHDVGIYQSVFKLTTLALIIPDIAVYTMMPVLSRMHQENPDRWNVTGRSLYRFLFLLSLPISLTLFLFSEQVINTLYGAKMYAEAVPILRIFAFIIFIRFGSEAYALMLTTARNQGTRMVIVMVGTVLNIVLNSFAIPAYGPWGAAMVSLLTNGCVAIGYIVCSRRSFVDWSLSLRGLVSLSITVALGGAAWGMRFVSIWMALPLIAAIYVLVVYFVGLAPEERGIIFGRGRSSVISMRE